MQSYFNVASNKMQVGILNVDGKQDLTNHSHTMMYRKFVSNFHILVSCRLIVATIEVFIAITEVLASIYKHIYVKLIKM